LPAKTDPLAGLDFRGALKDVRKGVLLKPLVTNYLCDVPDLEWPGMPRRDFGDRPPDGWFHPSTHPVWPERALYEYLAHPGTLLRRDSDYMRTLSLAFGISMHGFFRYLLGRAGLLPAELQRCTACPAGTVCEEPGVCDEEAGERGHLDGVLALPRRWGEDIYELKTATGYKLAKLADLDEATFRDKWPEYWLQQQSYQRMSGRRRTVVLIVSLGYPWDMREIHVHYDQAAARAVREKYLRVRQAVADQRPPRCGCFAAQATSCGARGVCAS
jgi:hypothetical protein